MDNALPPKMFIVAFPFFFLGMWCAISLLLSRVGGWHRLARAFPARGRPQGTRFSVQSGKVGMVNYNNCLTIYVSPDGLYLSVWPVFRIGHPPLFVPWDDISNPRTRRFLWVRTTTVQVGSPNIATIQLSTKILGDQSDKV
jgi:hypothetical protein